MAQSGIEACCRVGYGDVDGVLSDSSFIDSIKLT
eukprot:IDg15222t1